MLKRTIDDLGFSDVVGLIRRHALSTEGALSISNDPIITDKSLFIEKQERIQRMQNLLESNLHKRPESFVDISPVLQNIQDLPYQRLEGSEIYDVGLYINSAIKFQDFLKDGVDVDFIGEIDSSLINLVDEIFFTLESPGTVKKTHPAIARALAEIERTKSVRFNYSTAFVQKNAALMQGDKPSFKDSRVVIPIRADQKNQLPSLVHSYSSSRNTIYVEPLALVELNNSVVMAEQNLELEISRLLNKLSSMVFSLEMQIRELSRRVCESDKIYSYAIWAKENDCSKTYVSEDETLKLINCRHPLLKKSAIPINVSLSGGIKGLVISGPNAGGKTVTIKTVGLMALVNQICGFIPADDGSSLPLFDEIYTDIGDDQSIEAALSTFSGHMQQISFILKHMTKQSLVILDELGSGTDEVEGSAIARSVLQYCLKNCKFCLISSHHSALKQFAYVSANVTNASMEFDEKTHKPTFKVIAGLPGESHAIDTAIRMRLPKEVINEAKSYLGKNEMSISSMIKGLEAKRVEADKRILKLKKDQEALSQRLKENEQRSLNLDKKEVNLKSGKVIEMDNYISHVRKELEKLVRELREGELTKEKTKKVKAFIAQMDEDQKGFKQKVDTKTEVIEKKVEKSQDTPVFEVGHSVLCGTYKRVGTITRSEGKGKWQVAIGPMKFVFKESELTLAPLQEKKVNISYNLANTMMPKLSIDVRGATLEEAKDALNSQIEACNIHGLTEFSIVHGYGNGILSTGLHRYLRSLRGIASFHYAIPEDGGQGKTYVKLG